MSIFSGLTRGGARGGKDQFDWEEVKADKDRENYLGHSLKAPVGRWQKGKDLQWYTKSGKSQSDILRAEVEAVKKQEEEAMAIALGLKKGTIEKPKESLTKQDITEAVRRNSETDPNEVIDRPKGVGFGSHRMALAAPVAMETTSLPGTGITGTVKPSEGQANKMAAGSKEAAEEDTEKEASTKKSKSDMKKEKKHKKSKRDHKRRHHRRHDSSSEDEGYSRRKRKKEEKQQKHKRRHRHDSSSN